MGLIMRNDIPYGGKEAIDSQKNEVIIGDGNKWTKGSDFFTNVIVGYPGGVVDTTYEPLTNSYTGLFYIRISSLKNDFVLKSIKVTDKTKQEQELITEDNVTDLVNKENDSVLFIEADEIDSNEVTGYTVKKNSQTLFTFDYNPDDSKITIKKSGAKFPIEIGFRIANLNKTNGKIISVTIEDTNSQKNLFQVISKTKWAGDSIIVERKSTTESTINFNTDDIIFTQKRIGSLIKTAQDSNSTLMFCSQVKDYDSIIGNPNLSLSNNAEVIVGGNAKIYADGTTRFTLHDNAWLDVNQNAQVKFGWDAKVFIDPDNSQLLDKKVGNINIHCGVFSMESAGAKLGHNPDFFGDSNYNNIPHLHLRDSADVNFLDSAYFRMNQKASFALEGRAMIHMIDGLLDKRNDQYSQYNDDKFSPTILCNPRQIQFFTVKNDTKNRCAYDYKMSSIHSNPTIEYNNRNLQTVSNSHTSALDIIQSKNWFNDNTEGSHSGMLENLSPLICTPSVMIQGGTEIVIGSTPNQEEIDPTSLTKIIIGTEKGGKFICDMTSGYNSESSIRYGGNGKVHLHMGGDTGSECIFRLQPRQNSCLYLDASTPNNSKVYVQLQPSEEGKLMYLLNGKDIFMQHTGQFHAEYHDSSTIVMRGGEQFYTSKQKEQQENFVPFSEIKPWNDGEMWVGWRRPVPSRELSPIIGMYDGSNFVMRGAWNIDLDLHTDKTLKFSITGEDELANKQDEKIKLDDLKKNSAFQAAEKEKNCYITGARENQEENGLQVTKTPNNSNGFDITVSNFTYTTKPHDWQPHIAHQLYHPTLEVIENAEIRLGGYIYIQARSYIEKDGQQIDYNFFSKNNINENEQITTAITIGTNLPKKETESSTLSYPPTTRQSANNEDDDKVTFTIEDLKALKKLIENVKESNSISS